MCCCSDGGSTQPRQLHYSNNLTKQKSGVRARGAKMCLIGAALVDAGVQLSIYLPLWDDEQNPSRCRGDCR